MPSITTVSLANTFDEFRQTTNLIISEVNALQSRSSSNSALTIVLRDAAGNFSANTISANTISANTISANTISANTISANTLVGNTNPSSITGIIPTNKLASGTANANTYLRGDQTWAVVVSGATLSDDSSSNTDTFYIGMANNQTTGAWLQAYVSSTKLFFNANTGQLNATNFNSLSDERKKYNIKTIENATETILKLRGVTFNWKETNKASIGVIAQEIEKFVPEAVSTSSKDEKSVNYGVLVGLLIQVVKEQDARIKTLEEIIIK